MIKELSKAKENAFKHAQWPLQLLKTPSGGSQEDVLKFRVKSLKVCKQIV